MGIGLELFTYCRLKGVQIVRLSFKRFNLSHHLRCGFPQLLREASEECFPCGLLCCQIAAAKVRAGFGILAYFKSVLDRELGFSGHSSRKFGLDVLKGGSEFVK